MAHKRHYASKRAMAPNSIDSNYHDAEKYRHDKSMAHSEASMIREDHMAPCLLPRDIHDKEWPRSSGYINGHTPTLFRGEQEMMKRDRVDYAREYKPKKW